MLSPGTAGSLAGGALSLPRRPERFDSCSVAIDIWLLPNSSTLLLRKDLGLTHRDVRGLREVERDRAALTYPGPLHRPVRRRANHIGPLPGVRVPAGRARLLPERVLVLSLIHISEPTRRT